MVLINKRLLTISNNIITKMYRKQLNKMKFLKDTSDDKQVVFEELKTNTCQIINNCNSYCESLHLWQRTSVLQTFIGTLIIYKFFNKSLFYAKIQTAYLKYNFICIILLNLFMRLSMVVAIDLPAATTPMQSNGVFKTATLPNEKFTHWMPVNETRHMQNTTWQNDSIFMRLKQQFSSGNELWDGIIRDCYQHPTFTCFQKNVYFYLNDALSAQDVNITKTFKFYKNNVEFNKFAVTSTESALSKSLNDNIDKQDVDEHLLKNEIPSAGRNFPAETPIEEVTNALYDKSVKFAMTHDMEIQMPEIMFDGATFRISPKSIEGNGVIAKLELIPKQQVEARLAGKIIMKKIQKFLKSKLLLSFLALLLIIKIIKIKLFWLLPLIVGVGAAKKLLLKFLLFLFPALSHLFKLCSYYQQTYHSTKYHHHHHLINHHHTIVPAWHHHEEHSSIPEVIYTHPPKGHVSAYLHGAPIHETYGPPAHEHHEGGWESSGPGLGSEYINDINRVAQIDEKSNYFKPHTNDANEINEWGLGTTSAIKQNKILQQKQQLATQQQRPPIQKLQIQKQQQVLPPQLYQRPHATSHIFNPYVNTDKQSIYNSKYNMHAAQSGPSPVYYPSRHGENSNYVSQFPNTDTPLSDIQKQPISPEVAAQLKEAIRRQTEQRIIAQQQQILEKQPFVQDGEPLVTKNYDPFYSPILVKIDKIVEQLGVKDDLCKARLICNMYRDPARFSPHSNFVSAELSRDTNELPQVSDSEHPAVMRFFRYIQAARDGQEQKNCLLLYPECSSEPQK